MLKVGFNSRFSALALSAFAFSGKLAANQTSVNELDSPQILETAASSMPRREIPTKVIPNNLGFSEAQTAERIRALELFHFFEGSQQSRVLVRKEPKLPSFEEAKQQLSSQLSLCNKIIALTYAIERESKHKADISLELKAAVSELNQVLNPKQGSGWLFQASNLSVHLEKNAVNSGKQEERIKYLSELNAEFSKLSKQFDPNFFTQAQQLLEGKQASEKNSKKIELVDIRTRVNDLYCLIGIKLLDPQLYATERLVPSFR